MLQVPYLFFAEETPFAAFNILFGETGKYYSVEVLYIIPQRFKYAANDSVTPAVDLHTYLGFIFIICIGQNIHTGWTIFQRYAFQYMIEVFFLQRFIECYCVNLFYFIAWVGKFLRQLAIIC